MSGVKISVIGAGSTYTPELIEGLIKRKTELPVKALHLMDIDSRKLQIVGSMARRMLDANDMQCEFVLTENLEEAIRDSDFVLAQIRVGKLEARILDERIPLKYDLIGQETTGIGGFMKAMRTIPAMMELAACIKKYCPKAWLINFSNPSGLIAQALLNHTDIKMIGLCNSPVNMRIDAMKRVPKDADEIRVDFVGLNHLVWITSIFCDGQEVLQKHLQGDYDISFMRNIPHVDVDPALLRIVRGIPSSYLTYYYYREEQLRKLKGAAESRGEVCRRIEEELLQLYADTSLKEKPAVLDQRGGHNYSEAAISVVSAIYNDKNELHVVDVKNNGALDFMEDNDVIEAGCIISKDGAAPISVRSFDNGHIKGLMKIVKEYERLAVRAGLEGNYSDALNALLLHPLIGDYTKAKGALDELLQAHRAYLPQFFDN